MKQPAWATRLADRILKEYEVDKPSRITWIKKDRSSSSGRYYIYEERIVINAGTDKVDRRLVFLHELAHHINHLKYGGDSHDDKFWDITMALFHDKRNRVKKKQAIDRSVRYKRKAAHAYARLKAK